MWLVRPVDKQVDGFVQNCIISTANALEILHRLHQAIEAICVFDLINADCELWSVWLWYLQCN